MYPLVNCATGDKGCFMCNISNKHMKYAARKELKVNIWKY